MKAKEQKWRRKRFLLVCGLYSLMFSVWPFALMGIFFSSLGAGRGGDSETVVFRLLQILLTYILVYPLIHFVSITTGLVVISQMNDYAKADMIISIPAFLCLMSIVLIYAIS